MGWDNHELGDNYFYYVTLIVYLSTKFCNFSELSGVVVYWSTLLEIVKKNSSDQFCSIVFRVLCFGFSPVHGSRCFCQFSFIL